MKKKEIINEQTLKTMFIENFERLRAEGGHSLSPEVKDAAWQQVRMYWKKLRDIAEKVTDTEVRLNLPNQITPNGREFCIEGVVDIVREDEKVTMYDIKTQDQEFVKSNEDFYAEQLNVYAHIWQKLRNQRLDATAIIATGLPDHVMDAVRSEDPNAITKACEQWYPVVPIPTDMNTVQNTVQQFGKVVDYIEEHRFSPPALSALQKREGKRETFATRVCRNCDARFSCVSYRQYAVKYKDRKWTKLAGFYDMPAVENEQIDREIAAMPGIETAEAAAEQL
jgi:predicted RNA-binding protein